MKRTEDDKRIAENFVAVPLHSDKASLPTDCQVCGAPATKYVFASVTSRYCEAHVPAEFRPKA